MALAPGTRLGPYEIGAQIGAGGMGEVYRARDTQLHRDVAIKVLPEALAHDPERLARFEREATTLAALNHPNIAHIHGLQESDGTKALVMELVEGPTVADRIAHGAIPVDEALPIAKQIAEALEAAHEQGIIHRDLKPANVKVRPDGIVKVLDFGLAKALEPALSGTTEATASPTITSPALMTRMGVILGTAAYMSPEQAKGRAVDKRSDIWAFGCVLYEMLTGKRAFQADDVSDTLAAVLRTDPDWAALPKTIPSAVRALIEGCLNKDLKARIAHMSTVRFVINQRHVLIDETLARSPVVARQMWLAVALIVAIAAAAGGFIAWNVKQLPTVTPTVVRFSVNLGEDQRFTNGGRRLVDISPDGTQVAYVANRQLYLRSMPELEARPIAGTESPAAVTSPVFSPDGRMVAFWSGTDRTLKKVPVGGGTAVTVCQADNPFGMSWSADGLVFSDGQSIKRVSADGGTPETIAHAVGDQLAFLPQTLPDGRGTLFGLATPPSEERGDAAQSRIVVQRSLNTEPTTLIEGAEHGWYLNTGHIVYIVGGKLLAVAFDVASMTVKSDPVVLVEGIARGAVGRGPGHYAISNSGPLVYIPGPASPGELTFYLAAIDRAGKVQTLNAPPAAYHFPRVSSDGQRIVIGIENGKDADLWTYDLSGATAMRKLTFGGRNRFPVWSPDSQYIAFQSDREGDAAIFRQRADTGGNAERLTKPEPGTQHVPESWSRSGIISFSVQSGARFSLSTLSLSDKRVTHFPGVESNVVAGSAFSPNGKWIAYQAGEVAIGGGNNVAAFVEPFPPTGDKYQVSPTNRNGFHQFWSRDGDELFYTAGAGTGQWFAVKVVTQPVFTIGLPVQLPNRDLPFVGNAPFLPRNYDITPDGKRIIVVRKTSPLEAVEASTSINVVLNWTEELKQRAPTH